MHYKIVINSSLILVIIKSLNPKTTIHTIFSWLTSLMMPPLKIFSLQSKQQTTCKMQPGTVCRVILHSFLYTIKRIQPHYPGLIRTQNEIIILFFTKISEHPFTCDDTRSVHLRRPPSSWLHFFQLAVAKRFVCTCH